VIFICCKRKQIVDVTYGGARLIASKRIEADFDIRAHEHLAEKQAIGKLAAELFIEEGMLSVLIVAVQHWRSHATSPMSH